MRLCKGTTEYRKFRDAHDDIVVYVDGQDIGESWLYADEEEGEVCCMFIAKYEDGFSFPVFAGGQIATYLRYGKVKIDAWKLKCGICSPEEI